jgi:hypothetical protein
MDEAVSLLKEGLSTFEPMFPNRCEHNMRCVPSRACPGGGKAQPKSAVLRWPKSRRPPLIAPARAPCAARSPELGELHNQTALLLLFSNKPADAAHHAQARPAPLRLAALRNGPPGLAAPAAHEPPL